MSFRRVVGVSHRDLEATWERVARVVIPERSPQVVLVARSVVADTPGVRTLAMEMSSDRRLVSHLSDRALGHCSVRSWCNAACRTGVGSGASALGGPEPSRRAKCAGCAIVRSTGGWVQLRRERESGVCTIW